MICKNCEESMSKIVDPIIFGYPRMNRWWWKCPTCGAELPRQPDADELDKDKSRTYTSKKGQMFP